MNITIISVGTKSKHEISMLIDSYVKRLPKHVKLSWRFLKHGSTDDPVSSLSIESENILRAINPSDKVILLDETGRQLTSIQLSGEVFDTSNTNSDIVFIIGGAYGVNQAVKSRSNITLALGKLVYPHQIVRLVLAEQIYRAYTISIGHPYHHL